MQVQFYSDKTIAGNKAGQIHFSNLIQESLKHFKSYITTIEAHVSDENGSKDAPNTIHCVIEARVEGKQPIAVNHTDDNEAKAVHGAIEKMKSALDSVIGRMKDHH